VVLVAVVGQSRYCRPCLIIIMLLLLSLSVVGWGGEDEGELSFEACIRAQEVERGRGDGAVESFGGVHSVLSITLRVVVSVLQMEEKSGSKKTSV
jgi:hypothetical protein